MLSKKAYYILGISFLIAGFFLLSASFQGATGFSVLDVVEIDLGLIIPLAFFILGFFILIAFRKLQIFLIKKGIEKDKKCLIQK